MPINFQQGFFVFSKGLQQKVDSRLVGSPHLLSAENCTFQKTGSVQKRNGYDQQGSLGTTITHMSDFDNSIIAQTVSDVNVYSESLESFFTIGTRLPHKLTHTEIIRDNYKSSNPDVAETATFYVTCWESTSGSNDVRYSVTSTDGVTIVHDTLVKAGAQLPVVAITDNYVWIVYQMIADDSIRTRRINLASPELLETEINMVPTADIAVSGRWDIDSITEIGAVIVVYEDTEGSPGITAKYFNDLGEAGAGISSNGFPAKTQLIAATADTVLKVDTGVGANTDIATLVLWDDGTDVKRLVADFALNITVAAANWQATTSISRAATFYEVANKRWVILTQVDGGGPNTNIIYKGVLTDGGVEDVAPEIYQRGLTLVADPSSTTAGTLCWWALHESDIQPTYFLFEDTVDGYDGYGDFPTKIGKHLQGTAGTTHDTNHVCSSSFAIGLNKRSKFTLTDSAEFRNEGVVLVDVAAQSETKSHIAQIGRTSLMTGSLTQTFDKHQLVEHGFDIFPETLVPSQSGAAGVADGTYLYVATYEWTDANGDVHESAPSLPVSFTVTGGPRNVTVAVPTNRVTNKTDVIINLYRTTNGGTTYYKVTPSDTGFTFNDRDVDTVNIVDTTADATLTGRPTIYTNGGVLDNIAPPHSTLAITHKQRVFLAGDPEFKNRLHFSSVYNPGEALQFNETLFVDVEENTDNTLGISALATLDDNLVIFKRNSIFLISGLGPDRAGNQNDYQPRKINTDVGCDEPFSIITTPNGVMFKSEKGIYLLDRQFQTTYIGAGVEDFNTSNITAATLHADENHVRYALDTGEILYYNYFHDAWSTWTNYNADAAVLRESDSAYFHSANTGTMYRGNTEFRDDGAAVSMKIRTGWMVMGQPHQTKRVKMASVLGDRLQDHRITWNIYLDYSDVISETIIFDVRSNDALYGESGGYGHFTPYGLNDNTWGAGDSWGATDFYGGNSNDVMEYRHRLKIQKCRAVSFEFIDENIGTTSGPSFTFVGCGLEFGYKSGIKYKTARTV